jgi:hypothetical protein
MLPMEQMPGSPEQRLSAARRDRRRPQYPSVAQTVRRVVPATAWQALGLIASSWILFRAGFLGRPWRSAGGATGLMGYPFNVQFGRYSRFR